MAINIPSSYDAYYNLLYTVSNNLEALKSKKKKDINRTIVLAYRGNDRSETIDWEPTVIAIASSRIK